MAGLKAEIITFKVDATLAEAMRGIDNRSEFIREAVLMALDHTCPLCRGAGVITPKQKEHWLEFLRDHRIEECKDCHEYRLRCDASSQTWPDNDHHARNITPTRIF